MSVSVQTTKTTASDWILQHAHNASILVEYSYLANQPDAGACWVDKELLYVNPVHCCLYIPGQEHEPCTLQLDTGHGHSGWSVAIALPINPEGFFMAGSYHELVDSPFLASPSLQAVRWSAGGVDFVLWIQGAELPEGDHGNQILSEFRAFCCEQILTMGTFPGKSFQFMLLALPYPFYHGVEHLRSAVLTLGPCTQIWTALYKELLGLASHELYHAWNIKSIRPASMRPYRYEGLIFSNLGYVYEGFTTYYGDLFLLRSGLLTFEEYLEEINAYLLRHTLNYGRFNHGLHESSVDTWVDGYNSLQSAPHRRVSIYAEGMLQALHLDLTLRKLSRNSVSLDDLMRFLWNEHLLNPSRGYTEQDLIGWLHQTLPSVKDWDLYFREHYGQPMSIEKRLAQALEPVGCTLKPLPCEDSIQRFLGVQIQWNKALPAVEHAVSGSPAAQGGMGPGDRWLAWQTVPAPTQQQANSTSFALDPQDAQSLEAIEEPSALQTRARQILCQTITKQNIINHDARAWSSENPDHSSLEIREGNFLVVLYINPIGHYGTAIMRADSGLAYYNHYKITSAKEITVEQNTNRLAWISSASMG
jgi:predicted metalloprotease with PDZ domain